jgi:flagellar motor protein MotB
MVELPKVRLQRIRCENELNPYGRETESATWAISYADVLMVLLSFFVIFFSFGKSDTQSIIQKIIVATQGGSETPLQGTGPSLASKTSGLPMKTVLDSLTEVGGLDAGIKRIVEDDETLVLLFPDESYEPSSFVLQGKSLALFHKTMTTLSKYKDQINIVFVGFADRQPIVRHPSDAVQNNFDLSALRATRALEVAAPYGFSMEHLKAEGMGDFGRKSRSLSLRIHARESS